MDGYGTTNDNRTAMQCYAMHDESEWNDGSQITITEPNH